MLDSHLSMEKHVNAICRSCYFYLRGIARIRSCLDQHTAETIVHSLVSTRLDYCNSLLFGISGYLIQRLQRVQNFAARVVCQLRRENHITPILRQLHWLPVSKRIEFKVILITFKVLNGRSPKYLQELVSPYQPVRQLRSSNQGLLTVPSTRLTTFGDRAYSSYAPKLWNALPLHLRSITSLSVFKSKLKSHLFSQYYQ